MCKKLLSMLLIFALMLSLSGCSRVQSGWEELLALRDRVFDAVVRAIGIAAALPAVLFMLVLMLPSVLPYWMKTQQRIEQFVIENEALLLQAVAQRSETLPDNSRMVKSVSFKENSAVFCCAVFGLVPSGGEKGFFYTEGDPRDAAPGASALYGSFVPEGSGTVWHGGGGDSVYFEPICGNFYFYESSW